MKISESQVRAFRTHIKQEVRSTTANFILRHLKAAFEWAVTNTIVRYLYENPFKQKDLFLKVNGENLPRCLTPYEKKQLLSVIDREDHRRFFQFLLLTGCRRNEALNLRWSDIDWERKEIVFKKTKSGKSRVIPVGIELMQILLNLDRDQSRPYNFLPDYVTHEFKKYVKAAVLSEDIHLHCLGHTAASDLSGKECIQL